MYVQEGSIVVAVEPNRDTAVMVPGVVAHISLICPACKHITCKTTPHRNLSTPNGTQPAALDRLDDILNMVVIQFCNGTNKCAKCGTFGGLPESSEAEIKVELAGIITHSWLNAQLDQLAKEARANLKISDGIMQGAKRTVANLRPDRPILRAV